MNRAPGASPSFVRSASALGVALAMAGCSLIIPDDDELKGGPDPAASVGATGASEGSSQGGAGSGAGGAGGAGGMPGGGGGSGGALVPAYTIHTPPGPIDYDYPSCGDFHGAPTIPFWGHKEATDNTIACRLLWVPERGLLHGCCDITDAELQATHASGPGDSEEYWLDDGIELILSAGTAKALGPSTIKTALTVRGAHWDANFPGGAIDKGYEGLVKVAAFPGLPGTIDDPNDVDTGYVLKWEAEIGFDVAAGDVAMCNFILNDDDASGLSHWIAFGTDPLFNMPRDWEACAFVDAPPP